MDNSLNTIASELYDVYGAAVDFTNYQGLPMPKFEDLPERPLAGWIALAKHRIEPEKSLEPSQVESRVQAHISAALYMCADLKKLLPRDDPHARFIAVLHTQLELLDAYAGVHLAHRLEAGLGHY